MLDTAYPKNIRSVEGKVRIEYTEPLTGKVRERVDGENHAFSQCFNVCQLQRRLLHYCPLVISDWAGEIDYSMPIIPGNKIGYGIPGYGSSGDYRGLYRAADSFYDNIVDQGAAGATSTYKYVYDFTPSQIPGDIKVIGLSIQDLQIRSAACCELSKQTCLRPFNSPSYNSVYALLGPHYGYQEEYISLSASSPTLKINLLLPVTDTYNGQSKTQNVDLSSFLEPLPSYYSGNISFLAYNVDNDTFVAGIYWYDNESPRNYYLDVYEFSPDLSERVSFVRYANSNFNMDLGRQYSIVHGGNLYRFYNTVIYKYALSDIGNAASLSDILVKTISRPTRYGTTPPNISTSSWYIRLNVLSSKYVVCTLNADSPVLDLENDAVYGGVSEGGQYLIATDNISYINGLPVLAARRECGSPTDYYRLNGDLYGNVLMSAITLYKMPPDAPPRPAGYGVTISYELKIQWE